MRCHPCTICNRLFPTLITPISTRCAIFCTHPKINIPVVLYQGDQIVYAAEVKMIGHGHALYKVALDAVREEIKHAHPPLNGQCQLSRSKIIADMAQGQCPHWPITSAFIARWILRRRILTRSRILKKSMTNPTVRQQNWRLKVLSTVCARRLSRPALKSHLDPAYAPLRKGILHRFMPKF